jgi:hypothetical protein
MDSDISKFVSAFEKDVDIKRKIIKDIESIVSEKFKRMKNDTFTKFVSACVHSFKMNIGIVQVGNFNSEYVNFIDGQLLHTKLNKYYVSENVYFTTKKLENDYLSEIEQAIDSTSFLNFEEEMHKLFTTLIIEKNRVCLCWEFLE